MGGTRQDDTLRTLDRRVSDLEGGSARRLVREPVMTGGARGKWIYAEVDGTVGTGDPTGSFINATDIIPGSKPADGTGTFQNQYGQEYASGDDILLFQLVGSSQWLTERGGTAGSQVIAFRLTEDKSYADAEALAKPINADGTLNSGADAFHVVDHEGQFYGLAAYTDGDTGAAAHPGYLGHAVRFTDDYAAGVPGYRIINMEGPEHFILVELTAAVSSGSATCNFYEGGDLPAGGGDSARRPRIEDDAFDVTVYDDLNVAAEAVLGDAWWAVWDRDDERYIFDRPVEQPVLPKPLTPGLLIAEIPAVTITGSGTNTVVCGSQANAIVLLEETADGEFDPVLDGMSQITLTGKWRGKTALRGSSTEPVMVWGLLNDAETVFTVVSEFDMRALPGFNATDVLLAGFNAASAAELEDLATWLNRLAGYTAGNSQAIQHGASDTTEWEDTEECA